VGSQLCQLPTDWLSTDWDCFQPLHSYQRSNFIFFIWFICSDESRGMAAAWSFVVTRGRFPGKPGLAGSPLILNLHWSLSWASSQDRPKLFISALTQSHLVFFLCLVPSVSINTNHLTRSPLSLCATCPNHRNLPFLMLHGRSFKSGSEQLMQPCGFLMSQDRYNRWNFFTGLT